MDTMHGDRPTNYSHRQGSSRGATDLPLSIEQHSLLSLPISPLLQLQLELLHTKERRAPNMKSSTFVFVPSCMQLIMLSGMTAINLSGKKPLESIA